MTDTLEYVQYGCGLYAPRSWRNFDASPTLRLQRLPLVGRLFSCPVASKKGVPIFPRNVEHGDIVKGLSVKPGACKAIYCASVLEHLALNDFRQALVHTHGYLMEGGIFRLVVPDPEKLCRDYLTSAKADACSHFMEQSGLGQQHRRRGFEGMLRRCWGNSLHLWMWDFKGIAFELNKVGFKKIRPAEYNDSADPRFIDVETVHAWRDCVAVECIK